MAELPPMKGSFFYKHVTKRDPKLQKKLYNKSVRYNHEGKRREKYVLAQRLLREALLIEAKSNKARLKKLGMEHSKVEDVICEWAGFSPVTIENNARKLFKTNTVHGGNVRANHFDKNKSQYLEHYYGLEFPKTLDENLTNAQACLTMLRTAFERATRVKALKNKIANSRLGKENIAKFQSEIYARDRLSLKQAIRCTVISSVNLAILYPQYSEHADLLEAALTYGHFLRGGIYTIAPHQMQILLDIMSYKDHLYNDLPPEVNGFYDYARAAIGIKWHKGQFEPIARKCIQKHIYYDAIDTTATDLRKHGSLEDLSIEEIIKIRKIKL
ncbi:hypothetical protein [Kordiimonas aquimaris]|uniref:hypothetical protein n=1 Tax=Kordiimonas aquimaris TaxID=707591 RepID=UPI0021D20A7C|nr:hypothetical protein [Kordiimonas aquimaris]